MMPENIGDPSCKINDPRVRIVWSYIAQYALLLLIDNIAVTLDAAGCIRIGKLAKAKEVISNVISEWFSSITDYIKMYIQLPQTS